MKFVRCVPRKVLPFEKQCFNSASQIRLGNKGMFLL
jgi:hypothetical protein